MKKQNNMLFLVMSMLCMQILSAQAMTVSGTVTDAQTGEALVGTQVFVKGTFVGMEFYFLLDC
jgi:Ca-activated chloride channel family protein